MPGSRLDIIDNISDHHHAHHRRRGFSHTSDRQQAGKSIHSAAGMLSPVLRQELTDWRQTLSRVAGEMVRMKSGEIWRGSLTVGAGKARPGACSLSIR